MTNFWGRRGLAAALGLLSLVMGPSEAIAQTKSAWDIAGVVRSIETGKPALAAATATVPQAAVVASATTVMSKAIQTVSGTLLPATKTVATEAAWLHQNGWPLYALVDRYSVGAPLNEEATCLATAVYFEARGESVEGQLAVARVVMNRAASGRYPTSWCATVKQPWQFSFVRNGQFPYVDSDCDAWRKAQGIARLAMSNAVPSVSNDVLWYHANYVAPSWGRRLTRVSQIGAHIFYRA